MSSRHRRLAAAAILCSVALLTVLLVGRFLTRQPPAAKPLADLAPVAPSPFRNTRPEVAYVGMQRCQSCHADAHATYSHTAHSQALTKVDLASEPSDGEFDDPQSMRHYRIYRQGEQMWHEESIRTTGGEKLILANLPVEYAIGSGRFSRSYLVNQDGFLFESPATWYAARPGWSLSPGFEKSNAGFQRPVELRCLTCHAGRIEPIDHSPQKVTFHAASIDCERCHGPGELHVQRRESTDQSLAGFQGLDDTIVNPAHLSRQLREDICAQCHLHGAATVELRGRNLQDFRPGQHLADYAVHFGLRDTKQQMEVVGHVEQMRLSRCYQASETLTCTTCHDPHAKPFASEKQSVYRQKCLSCHTSESCGQPGAVRHKSQPDDNCVACHMPRGPTEIPHFAFTHHRIGIHGKSDPPSDNQEASELIPISEAPNLSEIDKRRNLGLGYLLLSDGPGQGPHAESYRAQSLQILTQTYTDGLQDPQSDAALARLNWGTDPQRTLQHAKRVIESPAALPDDLATACFTLGATYYAMNQPAKALPWLEKTITLRPTADVLIMLADCQEHQKQLDQAITSAQRASELAPDRPRYLQRYAELLVRSGKAAQSKAMRSRIEQLFLYRQRLDKQRR